MGEKKCQYSAFNGINEKDPLIPEKELNLDVSEIFTFERCLPPKD